MSQELVSLEALTPTRAAHQVVIPEAIADAGDGAAHRFFEFFTASHGPEARRPMQKVRMSLDGYDPTNLEDACHFVGVFHRKATEQGWTEAQATETVQRVTAKQAFEWLRQHIEPTPPEPVTWRTQIERIHDYKRGIELLSDDPNVKPNPFRWWLRGFELARHGRSHSETLAQDVRPGQEPEHDLKPRHDFRMKF